jgi:S1-C subfamily serine protease
MQIQSTSLTTLSADVASLAKQASQSIVALRDRGRWFSGFYWRPDVIASASERVAARRDEKIAVIAPSQDAIEGVVIGRDPTTDLALIRVPATAPAVAPAAGAQRSLGEVVLAAGRSRHGPTCAVGFIALAGQPWRSMHGGDIGARIWLDISLTPQSEGSAVFDASGLFIGMAVYAPRRRILLIPAETIERVGQELLAHGRIRRGYLGVGVQAVAVKPSSDIDRGGNNKTGLMIISLDPKGPAAQAGLQQGDIILAFDGNVAGSARVLAGMLRNAGPGKTANLDISRSGQDIKVSVALGESPTA